jgi:hypothetical protein
MTLSDTDGPDRPAPESVPEPGAGETFEPLAEPSPGAAGDLSRFAGEYAWPDRRVEVTATDAALVLESARGSVEALPLDDRTFLVDPDDPDVPTTTFGEFDDGGRPHVLYQMLWGLPRV